MIWIECCHLCNNRSILSNAILEKWQGVITVWCFHPIEITFNCGVSLMSCVEYKPMRYSV